MNLSAQFCNVLRRSRESLTIGHGCLSELSILAASLIPPQSRTLAGEPKDDDYVFDIVANEPSTNPLERVTRDKGIGWYVHDASQWFVQGIEGYFGLMNASRHEREVTLPKYVAKTRELPGEVRFDGEVRVGNPYLGGLTVIMHLTQNRLYGNLGSSRGCHEAHRRYPRF